MRTEFYQRSDGEWVTRVILSRRNLLVLLAKLDGHPFNSACTIVGSPAYPATQIVAEEDHVHYSHESRPLNVVPGPMHPETEAAVRERGI